MESILHLLFLLQFLPLLSSSESYNPQVKYFMNCGSTPISTLSSMRFLLEKATLSKIKTPYQAYHPFIIQLESIRKILRYMLNITQTGSYLIRLHFFPFSFKKTHLTDALFNVSASNFPLLSNLVSDSSTDSSDQGVLSQIDEGNLTSTSYS
uniref:Malectin-like domain-containing protein n=1 Tax=Salix viminalis TaxID=40686 RepID=A0A6N2NA48_SALVM